MRMFGRSLSTALIVALSTGNAIAQASRSPNETAAIAAADSLLAALSRDDKAAIARFTTDSAILGYSAIRGGAERARVHSWAEDLARPSAVRITERGFGASARVQDRLAQVWMPYDIYLDGKWSHCGVDAFTLLKIAGAWRVASLFYTVEQPPACVSHPAGPPPR
ncbi:MAG: hypothetical protein Q8K55_04615 [Gemmatimonadaceae bacterium]|nr:hypothetical protein [Gemmatimonadaceae bacterium]